ncbi:MAG: hypothetical protein ED559_11785 [Phycisphaera sp.]|nr:MAG: hypothetical protein ED559_11785 [Phycisphaera sp.]
MSFDNSDGVFAWTPSYVIGVPVLMPKTLDLTLSPSDNQVSLSEPFRSFSVTSDTPSTSSQTLFERVVGYDKNGRAQIAKGQLHQVGGDSSFIAKTFQSGDQIGPNDTYDRSSALWTHSFSNTNRLVGDRNTIGVRFATDETGESYHYGYIALEWKQDFEFIAIDGFPITLSLYQPVAWAYETTPDTPIMVPDDPCLADVNGDGMATPADFTAWINAYNNNLPTCDQNGDNACTPTDFTAWVNNFNSGC